MARPTVLVAFDPVEPEEANAISDALHDVADVRWLHEFGGRLENAPLDAINALLCFKWPSGLATALGRMSRLRFIQRVPAGVDGFPFASLPSRVQLAGGSGSNATWVAEHAMALTMAAAKRIPYHDREMRQGRWHQTDVLSKELARSTLGVLGYGSVGRRVGRLAQAFGMTVLALRSRKRPDDGPEVLGGLDRLPALLEASDFVVVSLPLTRQTRGVLGADELNAMRTGAVLVNVSRGDVVDPQALYDHLALHPEFTAALDVWWEYPGPDGAFRPALPFHELPNVVMTPHNAAMVPRYRTRMARHAAQNVARFLTEGRAEHVVEPDAYQDVKRPPGPSTARRR